MKHCGTEWAEISRVRLVYPDNWECASNRTSRGFGTRRAPHLLARPSVCFVAPNAYAALSGRQDVAHIGGAQRQQILLSEELVPGADPRSFSIPHSRPPPGKTPPRTPRLH